MKGETMVRKLLLWQTNKEAEGDEYPAFVLHFTDFSPSRKTPLTREVRVSSSREQMEGMWSALLEENIKKGWELHSSTTAEPKLAEVVPVEPPAAEAEAPAKPKKRAVKKK
jgi:hypothetical protein